MNRSRVAIGVIAASCLLVSSAHAADDLTKPIGVDSSHHFLVQSDGAPFFWLGDVAVPLVGTLDRSAVELYLSERTRDGINVIVITAIGPDSLSHPNPYGELPLLASNPETPNPRYFENIDWIVDRAAAYGIRTALMPVFGLQYVVEVHSQLFDAAKAAAFGRWLGSRYRNKGIIWVLGGDMTPLWSKDWDGEKGSAVISDYRPIFDAMARGITEGDGGHPFMTYHMACCSWSGTAHPRTSLYLSDRAWLGMNMIHSSQFLHPEAFLQMTGLDFSWNGPMNYAPISEEYDSLPVRPVVDGTPRREGMPIDEGVGLPEGSSERWSAYDSRNAAYHAVFAGAAGHTYDGALWELQPSDERWKQALTSVGVRQMRYVKALMLSRPYLSRIPDQTLILGDPGAGTAHISATRDKSGSYAMVYLPSPRTVTLDLTKLSAHRPIAWWFNPRTGAATRLKRIQSTGSASFTSPKGDKEDDWVLVLDDENRHFAAPGSGN
jgi:Protein of unknown function (DUF4038)/Putative collagen-binding domain of a collagenase